MGMAIGVMLNLSCEREAWQTDDYTTGSGEPVQIQIAYQAPESDVVVTTRSMSSLDEHEVEDLYVLVFKAPTPYSSELSQWERVLTANDVANSYFDEEKLRLGKKNYEESNGSWNSFTDGGTVNATFGTVVVEAAATRCLIYAIANVQYGEDDGNATGTLFDALNHIDDAQDLYDLQAELNLTSMTTNGITMLERDGMHLLMSGVFVPNNQKESYNANYLKGTAGMVDLSSVANVNVVDLTATGVIKLRRLSSHINFEIEVADYFSDFKPESWQVVHVPTKSKLMDEGDAAMTAADRIVANTYFTNSPVHTAMLHTEGKYHFDFYMFENHKKSKETDVNWYRTNYGASIPDTDKPGGGAADMLAKYANVENGTELFKYAKRELEQKETTGANIGKVIWNTPNGPKTNPSDEEQLQGSKQFVYSEPNATYVVIKGRLMVDHQNVRDLTQNTTKEIEAAYAEVTYIVHLGYARDRSIQAGMEGGAGNADHLLQDFNSLRNTKYTYKIKIDGLNSIYTHVVAEGNDVETSKLMPGASGHIGLTSDNVYNVDCHYNAFVVALSRAQVNNFFYEITTPFSGTISSIENPNHSPADADFKWIKVRFNGIYKEGEGAWTNTTDGVTEINNVQPYKKDVSDVNNNAYNGRLYNLKEMKEFIEANYASWNTIGLSTNPDYKAYFSVYIDEYFYDTPPLSVGTAWGNESLLYWHYFVNMGARFVSFGSADKSTAYTTDLQSSIKEPKLMIVQSSIQSHYSTMSADGFGVEHDNDTPNPRWYVVDTSDGTIPNTGFSVTNGWYNTWSYIENVSWDTYVASTVNTTYHNLNMVASDPAKRQQLNPTSPAGEANGSTDNPYKASAIRLCMNRNRDENGNGKIDQDELKWYLPSSLQVDFISLCHFSYYDPLLDYNGMYKNPKISNDTWGNDYIILPEMTVNEKGYDAKQAKNYTHYTYVTSDFKKVATHEVINTKSYSLAEYSARPEQMRCVRNLGIAEENQATTVPSAIFSYSDNRFDMSLLDSRSLRALKMVHKELEPSTNFSEWNRPYKRFRVAKNFNQLNKGTHGWASSIVVLHDALTNDEINPCRTYLDPGETEAEHAGSWRVPNLSELALMMFYDESRPSGAAAILPVSSNYIFVCNTVWSFTPSKVVWGRAFTTRYMSGSTDWSTTLTDGKYKDGHWQETEAKYNIAIRCVKDIDSGE